MSYTRSLGEDLQRVDDGVSAGWKGDADRRIAEKAALHVPFSSLDLWSEGLPQPRQRRALGPRLLKAHRQGLIVPTGRWIEDKSSRFAGPPGERAARRASHFAREWVGC